jgi:hypothetical protein
LGDFVPSIGVRQQRQQSIPIRFTQVTLDKVNETRLFTQKHLTDHVLKPGVAWRNPLLMVKILKQLTENVDGLTVDACQLLSLALQLPPIFIITVAIARQLGDDLPLFEARDLGDGSPQ